MKANRFNFRAFIKPYNKVYKVQSLENDGTFMAVKCFEVVGNIYDNPELLKEIME